MNAPNGSKQVIVHALHAQRQPIHARCAISDKPFQAQRPRISLHRNLCVVIQRKTSPERIQKLADLRTCEQGWRSAADKHAAHVSCAKESRLLTHFAADGLNIGFRLCHASRKGRKVTVGAFFYTKRNVDIDRNLIGHHSTALQFRQRAYQFAPLSRSALTKPFVKCSTESPAFSR